MRRIAFAAILACVALIGAANAQPGSMIIDDDGGGTISTYLSWWARVRDAGTPVRFRGICMSACTLGLFLPPAQMCAEPTASFGFHFAADDRGVDKPFTYALIARYYPPAIQEWLADKTLTLNRMVFLKAQEIIDLGVMKACE